MNLFAQTLDTILTGKGLSNNKAAKLSGIDPSLLRRYRKGERIPRTRQLIDRIHQGLALTITEKEELEIAYSYAKKPENASDQKDLFLKRIFQDNMFSSENQIEICPFNSCNFQPESSKKMYPLNSLEDLEQYLFYINEQCTQFNETLYTIVRLSKTHVIRRQPKVFALPDLKHAKHIILLNALEDHKKENLNASYLSHIGMCQGKGKHSFYVLKSEPQSADCNYFTLFTKHFLLKFEVIGNKYIGFLTFDSNIIKQSRTIFERCQTYSTYYGNDIHDVFKKLWEET